MFVAAAKREDVFANIRKNKATLVLCLYVKKYVWRDPDAKNL